ncbi:hypothetical protein, partial [Xanthomonas campestris]|uniref:hypothetical protein n=1 Tax=Xanthomonas campestris TaxID=339 RepID=UPI001C60ABEE
FISNHWYGRWGQVTHTNNKNAPLLVAHLKIIDTWQHLTPTGSSHPEIKFTSKIKQPHGDNRD